MTALRIRAAAHTEDDVLFAQLMIPHHGQALMKQMLQSMGS